MIKIRILGNNSALPAHGRHPSSQVVEIREQLFLVDCGEGTQMQLNRFDIKRGRINHIFISHLHGDHYYGLIGLLTSMGLTGRTTELYLYGPKILKEIIDLQLEAGLGSLPYPLIFVPIEKEEAKVLVDGAYYKVSCFPVEHRIPTHGFLFETKSQGRKLIPEQCRQYRIPNGFYKMLKNGMDYVNKEGEIIKNEWVTTEANPIKKYAYCADTRITPTYLPFIQGVDMMYHESTYLSTEEALAYERFHSTAAQAARVAIEIGAKKLLLGHYSSRYKSTEEFEIEAKAIFEQTIATQEGMEIIF